MAIGTYEQVHGWNVNFRGTAANALPARFHSFDWHPAQRPANFHNIAVNGVYTPPVALDHQGHIVPQNILDIVLDPIANQAFNQQPNTLAALDLFLTANYPHLNFDDVTNYINFVLIPNGAPANLFVDPTGQDAEDYLGGYFSVIMWNPVNICRAPIDSRRGGTPGSTVDDQVINYLVNNLLLDNTMSMALQAFPPNPIPADTENFIAACNLSLATLQAIPRGYYQFPWKDEPNAANVLIPN